MTPVFEDDKLTPMKQVTVFDKVLSLLMQVSWVLFFTSFICSWRGITSICIILLLTGHILENRFSLRLYFGKILRDPFFIGCTAFFLLQLAGLLYTEDLHRGWKNIQLKSALVFIPLAFGNMKLVNESMRKRLFLYYCIVLACAAVYCLVQAAMHYQQVEQNWVFFYHELVKPFRQHAVYFSIYVFIALLFLLETLRKRDYLFARPADIILIVFFTLFIFLLSSKLVIAFYGLYLVYYFITLLRKNTTNRVLVVALFILFLGTGAAALTIRNPVSNRFYEIAEGNMKLVQQDKFDQGDYFNGLQFRILQWRFVAEILTAHHSWPAGVGPGDAQPLLDQLYISKHMYTGGADGRGRGFLGYNTHNQFLEALLQSGIIGLMVFIFITAALIFNAWKSRNRICQFVVLLLIIYSFSESVFETQYGILLYTFFPLFTTARPDTAITGTS
jgi:O-antigen ligase